MTPLEQYFYWLSVTCDAWGLFWEHMMEAAAMAAEPATIDLTNVISIRKGE